MQQQHDPPPEAQLCPDLQTTLMSYARFKTGEEKNSLINAGEQRLNIVLVYSTEGGIKGAKNGESGTWGDFQSCIFNVHSAVS